MAKKKTINIGLIGCGVVGMGVVKILEQSLPILERRVGARLRLKAVCDQADISLPPTVVHKPTIEKDWKKVVGDPDIDIVVELIGGYEPARTMVLAALEAGKHVATANKALLAKYWGEIFSAAHRGQALVYFEAAVGAGIPIVQGVNEGLAANQIEKICGILNGTTNYILTRMAGEGLEFAAALKAAQKAGFAEADPTFDIEGVDAAHKIAILASLAAGAWVRLEDVYREGISDVDVWDVAFAKKHLGLVLKLLGIAEIDKGRLCARVHPALIPAAHPFANVSMEYNAIIVHGDAVGDVMFYGKGAGQMTAASAVVSDVVYLARQVANGTAGQIPYVVYEDERRLSTLPIEETSRRHYLRFTTVDKPGVLSQITGLLGEKDISIASAYQEAQDLRRRGVPIVIVTHKAKEGAVRAALQAADKLPTVTQKAVHLRIEDFTS
jgi:homoserine dehydrogenase